jgi:protease IV
MARKRDIVIGVIIAASALIVLVFFAISMIGTFSYNDNFEFSGISGGNIGVVEVEGVINDTYGAQVIRQIDHFAKTGSIKAIILKINSPGGAVAPSQEMYDAVLRARKEKPVIADLSSVAASGGYYVACAADRIVANPGTLTGSIGVIFEYYTFKGLMDKVGIGTEVVKSGELKDVGSMSRPMTEKEKKMLNSVVMDTYDQFVSAISLNREMEREKVLAIADGSVFTGQQAVSLGLVDTLGGFFEAVNIAAEMANIKGEPNLVRRTTRDKTSVFDLVGQFLGRFNGSLDRNFSGPQLLYLFQ